MKYFFLGLVTFIFFNAPAFANDKFLDIQEVTSASGIKAWLVEDPSLPIIALQFSFKGAGAIRDGVEKQGTAQLLSNTLDEGAGALSSQEFQKKLADNSISLSFNSARDNFGGQVKTLSKNKDLAFELLTLALTKPRFDSEPLERMRKANITRIRSSLTDPEWVTARFFNDKAFENHPYALNSGGTLTTLKNITVDDLRGHLKDWITQDRLHIGVMGDITKEELTIILDRVFGNLPPTGEKQEIESLDIKNQGKIFVHDKDIPQTIISAALPSIDRNNPDYYALQLMNYIFGGGGFGSRLMEEAREKRGLTYGIYSSLVDLDHVDFIRISTSTENASAKEMLDIIQDEIKTITTSPVSDAELEDAKSYLIGSMPLSLTSTSNIAGILLSLQVNNRPIDYLDNYKNKINAVNAEDIQNIANRILKEDQMVVIMTGKPENIENFITLEDLPNVE